MTENKPIVFVITPFREEMLALYETLKDTFSDEFKFTNGGDLDNQQSIIRDIVEGIDQADVVIADLTGLNANVFYELGLAHAMNKKVICITQDIGELPFDLKSYRTIEYSLLFHKLPKLMGELRRLLHGAIDGSVKYGNPISDYLPDYFNDNRPCSAIVVAESEIANEVNISDATSDDTTEDGYLDYVADIVENAQSLTVAFDGMNSDIREMTVSVNLATNEIERVKRESGTAPIAFVRNICRNLADPIDVCAKKMKDHIATIEHKWSNVENSYLGLFDNKFTQKTGDKVGIDNSIDALNTLKCSMLNTKGNIGEFISVLQDNMGIERRLTRATNSLVTELEAYLNMTDTMSASIDRIITKGEAIFPDD